MILAGIKAGCYVAKNWAIKHSPELLLGTSIVAGIGATVSGCIATKKMEGINDKHKEILDILHKKKEENEPEYKREITKEYGRYWFDVAKAWAPCVCLTLASGTAALASFKIVSKRLIIAETAFAGVSEAFEKYRENVIEDQGEEKDQYYISNGALKRKEELIAEGKYKERERPELPPEADPGNYRVDDIFHYFFCRDTVKDGYYSDSSTYNLRFLLSAQTIFNRNLINDGVVYLDDVYRWLGLDISTLMAEKARGNTYGWTLDKYSENGMPNDEKIFFGILEYNDAQHRLFRSGVINDIQLHFNCRLLTSETCTLISKGEHV